MDKSHSRLTHAGPRAYTCFPDFPICGNHRNVINGSNLGRNVRYVLVLYLDPYVYGEVYMKSGANEGSMAYSQTGIYALDSVTVPSFGITVFIPVMQFL